MKEKSPPPCGHRHYSARLVVRALVGAHRNKATVKDTISCLEMRGYGCQGAEQSVSVNPEFSKPVPTNGFGEVEATVVASLGHPGAPRPRPITTPKVARKVCRIFSPVSTARGGNPGVGTLSLNGQRHHDEQGALSRPHTADAVIMYQPRKMVAAEPAVYKDGIPVSTAAGTTYSDSSADSARQMMVEHCSRPMTPDALSQRRHQQLRGASGRVSGSSIHRDAAAALDAPLRPSTSGGGRRRGQAVSHGRMVGRNGVPRNALIASPQTNEKMESSRPPQQRWQQQQEEERPPQERAKPIICFDGR